jgi:hypothetical protein
MTLTQRAPQNGAENTLTESRNIRCLLQNKTTINGFVAYFSESNSSWQMTEDEKKCQFA